MKIATTDTIEGYEIVETLGLVRGNVVRTKHIGSDFVAALQSIIGGEVHTYTAMIAGAREQALDRMVEQARSQGADGIVCTRFATSMIMRNAAELVAYGTAVRLKPRG